MKIHVENVGRSEFGCDIGENNLIGRQLSIFPFGSEKTHSGRPSAYPIKRFMKENRNITLGFTLLAFLLLSCVEGFARSWRPPQVPNGRSINCSLCHDRSSGGGPRNEFGEAVNNLVGRGSRAEFWSATLAQLDSDGDGFTNGEEMGDPDGDGVATPGAQVTNPGDPNSKPDPVVAVASIVSAEDAGLTRIVPDKIVFETDLDNLDNWEPFTSVIGNETFVIEANTFAEPVDDLNQNYAVAFQPVGGGDGRSEQGFFGDDGSPYAGQINASRQNGNPGRVAGDRRPGATHYVVGGEASPHAFDAFQSDDRWSLGFDRLPDGRYGAVQVFSLDTGSLNPTPTSNAIDAVNGRLTSGAAAGSQIGRFGGDVAVLDNGNIVVVVDDRSGVLDPANSATAVILAADGSVVKESWVVDPRDIWSNVSSYKGGFCVRVHDILYFYDNAGELLGQVHQVDDLPEDLKFDTGRGDATRIASHINSSLVYLAGTTDLFDSEGFELEDEEGQFRKGVQIAVFDASTQSFLSHRTVSEVSTAEGGPDDTDLNGSFGRVNLAVDALDRVAVAFEVNLVDADNAQTLVRVLSFDDASSEWASLTPSFFAFNNQSDFDVRTFRPSVSMTTKEILIAAKGEINSGNDPDAGIDTVGQTTFYTVFSHPDPQEDPTPGIVLDVDPIEITSVSSADGALNLTWIGGSGPFSVQRKTTLGGIVWVNMATTAERSVGLPISGPLGFFRVVDLGTSDSMAFSALLSAEHEVPDPADSIGSGLGTFQLEGNVLAFAISYLTLSGPATAAHIHGAASTTENAGVMIDLAPFNGGAFGESGTLSGSVTLSDEQKQIIQDGKAYVNIHTGDNPGGEVRGQIAPVFMKVSLSGASARPDPVSGSGKGQGTMFLQGRTLSINVQYEGLSGEATAAHIHGPAGTDESAGVLLDLSTFTGGVFGASGQIVGTAELTAEQLSAVIDGKSYVNIHTAANPSGEIRGQIESKLGVFPLSAAINGLFELPDPVLGTATGFGGLYIDRNDLVFTIGYSGLSAAATAAHIHGPASVFENGGVMINLEPFNGGAFGESGNFSGRLSLTLEQKSAILGGLTYINIHTPDNPGGELRGQIAPIIFKGNMSGLAERPEPVESNGGGVGLMTFVGSSGSFNIAYEGLSGPATAAHLHAPAGEDATGGVVLDLEPFNGGAFGVSGGMFSLAGNNLLVVPAVVGRVSYVNIHTEANPAGEIRGQVNH